MRKFKLNQKLVMDAVISAVIVQQAPALVRQFVNVPLTGMTSNIAGAVVGVVASMLLKKPDIATLSIAFAGADILNEVIGTTLLTGSTPVQDFISVGADGKPVFALSDYTNNPSVMPTTEYSKSYQALN